MKKIPLLLILLILCSCNARVPVSVVDTNDTIILTRDNKGIYRIETLIVETLSDGSYDTINVDIQEGKLYTYSYKSRKYDLIPYDPGYDTIGIYMLKGKGFLIENNDVLATESLVYCEIK